MKEEDQELKHACKLCNKSFPCGRSLGGHMRSHVINSTDHHHHHHHHHQKLKKKKLSSLKNGGINSTKKPQLGIENSTSSIGYVLRENPKKTCKFVDSSEDTLLHGKLCKECGKSFQSWKALFGHMKCHSERFSNSVEVEKEESRDSWDCANHKLVMDSQSDNETAVPNKGKRSSRRVATRYMSTTTSSSFSVANNNNNNASSSVSEIEQEQEEVAMCLMMLSRDLGHWAGFNNSVGEESDNNSEFLEAKSLIQTKRVTTIEGKKSSLCGGGGVGEIVKFKKLRNGKIELESSTCLDSENSEFDAKKKSAPINGFLGNDKFNKSTKKESEIGLGKDLINEAELGTSNNHSSRKRKFDSFGHELGKKCTYGTSDSENKSKFECTTCNKTFHSYQALGGHRASHKKIKGCFASKIDSSENSIEIEVSPNPNDDTKFMNCFEDKEIIAIDQEVVLEKAVTSDGLKKINNKGHECSICFKVFSSGQALGGHKRSHLIAEAKSNQSIVIQKPVQEIRDLLDLNLPAPVEEETNGLGGFKSWWVGSNHKHEPLVGLISN